MPTALDFDGEMAKYRVDHGEWRTVGRSPLVGFGVGLPPIEALNHSLVETVDTDRDLVRRLIQNVTRHKTLAPRPFAGSPIRSRPRRTYDPTGVANDAQGDYVPSFLAGAFRSDRYHWDHLKTRQKTLAGRLSCLTISLFGHLEIQTVTLFKYRYGNMAAQIENPQRALAQPG